MTDFIRPGSRLATCPPVEQWDDATEFDPQAWPRRVERHVMRVPTICFNCESACGLLAVLDRATGEVLRFEGNPRHPGSRGRMCAKGPAVLQQVRDADRVLHPMRRVGPRGGGGWERVGWDTVLADLGGRIRKAIGEGRGEEVMYHVGRPGYDAIMERTLQAWGIDGHNSHTNICSAAARLGYVLWHHADRPSPDHANARYILLLSAHLESGHYFNPHAQRIMEAKAAGARMAVMDPRLSNTASMADDWLPTRPGTETAVLLAMARIILEEKRFDAAFRAGGDMRGDCAPHAHADQCQTTRVDPFVPGQKPQRFQGVRDFGPNRQFLKLSLTVAGAAKVEAQTGNTACGQSA